MIERTDENLHRLKNNQNDWDNVPDVDLTLLQRIAKRTKGIVTAANAITIAGTIAVMGGLVDYMNGDKVSGVIKVGLGRSADVLDGYVANATNTKGRFGRDLDPTVDTLQLGFGLVALTGADVLPLLPAIAIAAPKIVGVVGSIAARLRHRELNPISEGKLGTASLWAGIGAFMLKGALDHHLPGAVDTGLEVIGWSGSLIGAGMSIPASREYVDVGFGPQDISNPPTLDL